MRSVVRTRLNGVGRVSLPDVCLVVSKNGTGRLCMRLHRGFVEYCQSGKMEEEENGLALDWIGQSVEMLRYKAMQKGKKR